MAKRLLTTFDEVIAALGGDAEVCALTRRSPQAVCNWRARGFFPAVLFDGINEALGSQRAAPELFRQQKLRPDANAA